MSAMLGTEKTEEAFSGAVPGSTVACGGACGPRIPGLCPVSANRPPHSGYPPHHGAPSSPHHPVLSQLTPSPPLLTPTLPPPSLETPPPPPSQLTPFPLGFLPPLSGSHAFPSPWCLQQLSSPQILFGRESLNFLIEIRDKYSGEGRREREEA